MEKRIAAGCVIIENDSILLMHRIDKDWFEVPGGKIDDGETLEQGAVRELKEELNCLVKIIRKLGDTTFDTHQFHLEYTWFLAEIAGAQIPQIGEPDNYDEIKFIPVEHLEQYRLSPSAKNLVIAVEKGEVDLSRLH